MSLTDGAATSESQASLSVVILILYTHQDVPLLPRYIFSPDVLSTV